MLVLARDTSTETHMALIFLNLAAKGKIVLKIQLHFHKNIANVDEFGFYIIIIIVHMFF